MKNIGYLAVGFNVGCVFANFVIKHGGQPWSRADEIFMLAGAFAVWTLCVFSAGE